MDSLVQSGKIRYWGASNHSAAQVREFIALSTRTGHALPSPASKSTSPSPAPRSRTPAQHRVQQLERELFPVVRSAGLGLLTYSPLDAGHLAPARPVEPGSPLARLVQVLDEVASGLRVSRAAVCVAWVLTHPEVTSVLGGAESPAHVDEHLAGTHLALPAAALAALNAASATFRQELNGGGPQHMNAEPDGRIVDAHVHVWSADTDRYPARPRIRPGRPLAPVIHAR